MPALKQETIDKRKKLYETNKSLLYILYVLFQGNIVQKQGRDFAIALGLKNANGTLYNKKSFNRLIADLEENKLIRRKQYYDTKNQCIVFRKNLIQMITEIDDINYINRISYSNKTFEVYDVNLFKNFYIISNHKIRNGKSNLNRLIENNTMFIDNSGILDIYKNFLDISKTVKPNADFTVQNQNIEDFKTKIMKMHKIRSKENTKSINSDDKINVSNEKGNYKYKVVDLYALKNRKVFLTHYSSSLEEIIFNYSVFCSTSNYDILKLLQNLGDTIESTMNFFNGIYKREQIKINFKIYTYNEKKRDALKNGLFEFRNQNYKNKDKVTRGRYEFTYYSRLLQDLKLNLFKDNFHFEFINTNINNDYREEATRFDFAVYGRSTGKKEEFTKLQNENEDLLNNLNQLKETLADKNNTLSEMDKIKLELEIAKKENEIYQKFIMNKGLWNECNSKNDFSDIINLTKQLKEDF